MANIEKIKRGKKVRYRISFIFKEERRRLALDSRYSAKQVDRIRLHLEDLVQSLETGGKISRATAGFIDEMPEGLRDRFVACGLLENKRVTNWELWQRFYVQTRGDRKPTTETTYRTVEKRFFSFFDPNGDPRKITKKDGEMWKEFLIGEDYAEASVAGSFQKANAVFNWAASRGYMESNPFKGIKRGSMRNPDRMFYVPMDWYYKLLDACPDQTWRTLLALCRIGGLRNPSETLRLKWEDLDWMKGAILVHSPKTEHHDGKDSRLIPMFPELRKELELQFELAEPGGSPYVIDRWRDTAANMRTYFQKIIFWAGLPTWERLFQNLRESRANEIWTDYPDHVAMAWMGHSKRVAVQHYLQVTDEQFQKALGAPNARNSCNLSPPLQKGGLKGGLKYVDLGCNN